MLKRSFFLLIIALTGSSVAFALPIFDTHIHFNADSRFKPNEVITMLREAEIKHALVSSNSNDPTFELFELAPDLILPSLRPYRYKNELRTWMHDASVIPYLKAQLKKREYIALGEFHAFGDEIDTPVSRQMIKLAKENQLVLHHHGDMEAVERIYRQWPEAPVLWAHAGFADIDQIEDMLTRYPYLWADLSHRDDIFTWGGFNPAWEALLLKHPDRFTLGADTYNDERWTQVQLYMLDSRDWLASLPDDVAQKIAYQNARSLLITPR